MIDSHMHIRAEDSSTPEKRAEWAEKIRRGAGAVGIDRLCLIGELNATREWGVTDPYRDPDEPRNALASMDVVRRNNDITAKYVEEHPDLFYGWARADPRHGEAAVEEFRRCVEELGLVGLKLHFRDSPVRVSEPAFEPLAEAAVDMGVPILSHVQQRSEPQASEEFWEAESWSEDVAALAESFPDLTFLSAHIGGGTRWEYRLKMVREYDNVYMDTSGSNCEAGIIERAVEELGVDRVVFGTDMPLVSNAGKLEGADLAPEQKATIAYNFERLLGENVPNRLSAAELDERTERARQRFAERAQPREERVVDAYAFTAGHWPFQPVDGSVEGLLDLMDRKGVDRAVVSSINAVMYRDPHNGNRELHERVAGHEDRLIPFATIDPTYPDWETDLRTCVEDWGMKGVRLLPAYHNYDLDEPPVARLMDACNELDVPVMFCAALEDQRHKHDLVDLNRIDSGEEWTSQQVGQLVDLLENCPETDVLVADASRHAEEIIEETTTTYDWQEQLYNGVRSGRTLIVLGDRNAMRHPDHGERLVEEIGVEHLVAGQQLPFKYFESYYNYTEHLPVDDEDLDRVRAGNLLELVGEE